jgi:hypothetical protein
MTRIAFAASMSVALAGGSAMDACPSDAKLKANITKKHMPDENCVNLSEVPQISAGIVASEPAPAAPKAPAYMDPTAAKYEGPTLGMVKPDPGVKAVPTIGYKWSLQ